MKRVFILRHAKTEQESASGRDIDRRLVDEGRQAASAIGAYMKRCNFVPDAIVCSAAARTKETVEIVHALTGGGTRPVVRHDLYLAESKKLLSLLRSLDDNLHSILLVGHNPGVAELALALAASPNDATGEERHKRLREKFSTCSLAVIAFTVVHWSKIKPGRGDLIDFMRPKDLKETD